jgi:hypothetical protein
MIVLNNGQRSNNIRLTKKGGKDAQGEMTAVAKYERSFSISRTSETGQIGLSWKHDRFDEHRIG